MVCSSCLLDPAIFAIFDDVIGKHQKALSASVGANSSQPTVRSLRRVWGRGWLLGRLAYVYVVAPTPETTGGGYDYT